MLKLKANHVENKTFSEMQHPFDFDMAKSAHLKGHFGGKNTFGTKSFHFLSSHRVNLAIKKIYKTRIY